MGEQGVDEGGVRKEFFMLICRELLTPNFGMFITKNVRKSHRVFECLE